MFIVPKVDAASPSYSIKKHEVLKTVENFEVLVKPGVDGKTVAKAVQKKCKKPCNIDVWDSQKALNLQLSYDKMKTLNEREAWKKSNYIYVADHFIGMVEFDLPKYYDPYPYRDFYYKELGGLQKKPKTVKM